VLCVIRQVFSTGVCRDREIALHVIAETLGYGRLGPVIRETLETDLLAAARRGILNRGGSKLSLLCRSIGDYDRAFLKDQFLASLGRTWTDRDDACRSFARWLGFARTGPAITATARSLINGLLREGRLETDGRNIRRQ
jgi:hypothetical protein